ncbi:MAG: four helix bundle protein [Candidatus Acidiferrales bacterium]
MDKPRDLAKRTKNFALRIIRIYVALPKTPVALVIGRQMLRSGTAVGANYREATRARSKSEYAAKMNIALMELEETSYWLELLEEGRISNHPEVTALRSEASELSAIFVSMIKKVRQGINQSERQVLSSAF